MRRTSLKKVLLLLAAWIVVIFLAASIILPTLNRFRRQQYAEGSIQNLHQIGIGILLYCNDHHGDFPDSLSTLIAQSDLSPKCLVDLNSEATVAEGSTRQQIASNISKGGRQSYIYLGSGMTDKTASELTLVAYEDLAVYTNGTNALFGDGHAEWITADKLNQLLAHPSTAPATQP